MGEAKFPKQLAVTEFTEYRKGEYRDRFDIVGDPLKGIEDFTYVADGDAVAIYELKRVDTYRNGAYLESD